MSVFGHGTHSSSARRSDSGNADVPAADVPPLALAAGPLTDPSTRQTAPTRHCLGIGDRTPAHGLARTGHGRERWTEAVITAGPRRGQRAAVSAESSIAGSGVTGEGRQRWRTQTSSW